ncbi:S24 family peptidase [Cobetia amphilecti]|uniref:LexA family transcriptional regulator n=1 Tax=Cobetia amphilecti TaxID=1055104 RepID=A0ABT6UTT3_9GAMM|nr:LexA family transcriptional regulator [Cobetia amphilecti]MDI5886066.1 LexA family transcriptional regulator [Cobetia amphilecti]
MSLLSDNIRRLMNHYGYSEAELGRMAGLTQPTVHRIVTGESKDPRPGNIEKIAAAFGTTYGNLKHNPNVLDKSTVVDGDAILIPSPQMRGYAPMISWEEVCDLKSVNMEQIPKNQLFPLPPGAGVNTVALQVRGESMAPRYDDGTIVFMDPDATPRHGDGVVFSQTGKVEASLKQFSENPGGHPLLKAINPSWPEPWIALDDSCKLLGVIVGALWLRSA